MQHVGNDIVDLRHPHAIRKSRNTRFLKRVFLPEETQAILTNPRPDAMLWAFWAGKEAAYKAVQKDCLDISASPRAYKVTFTRRAARGPSKASSQNKRMLFGYVETPRGTVSLQTLLTADYVHSVAASYSAAFREVYWQVKRIPSPSFNESLFVRQAALTQLRRFWPARSDDLEIRRDRIAQGLGPPTVYCLDLPTGLDISLSHDGNFAAFAFMLNPHGN